MNNEFFLMNKNNKILMFRSTPTEFGEDVMLELDMYVDKQYLPIGYSDILKWLENRRAPKHRAHIEKLLKKCGINTLDGFIRVAHALTLNDTFWVKEVGSALTWEEVSLYRNEFNELIAHIAFEGGLYGEGFSTTSPEFGTDGQFPKCWVKEEDGIFLLKRGSEGARNTGLEVYSEQYAAELAGLLCPARVDYKVVKYRGKLASKCRLFTSEQTGFVPVGKFVERPVLRDLIEFYEKMGSEDEFRRMLILDALIVNTDRHLGNFGVMIDTDTMDIIKMAPVFDNNRSLLPYAEENEFDNLGDYLDEQMPRIGTDFIQIAQAVLTPEIKADLINLKGFKFQRDYSYNFDENRLIHLENLVQRQIKCILS